MIELGETLDTVTFVNGGGVGTAANLAITAPGVSGGVKDGQTFVVQRGTETLTFEFDRDLR